MVIVILGVSGSGKTTLGQLLAAELDWPFFDADEFHPPASIEKMSRGIPLTDGDRWPWLNAIRAHIESLTAQGENGVVTCSGLKQAYRERLQVAGVRFVFLKGDYALIESRMKARSHFMRPDMLASQFAALEEPADALVVDVSQPPEECVRVIKEALSV